MIWELETTDFDGATVRFTGRDTGLVDTVDPADWILPKPYELMGFDDVTLDPRHRGSVLVNGRPKVSYADAEEGANVAGLAPRFLVNHEYLTLQLTTTSFIVR